MFRPTRPAGLSRMTALAIVLALAFGLMVVLGAYVGQFLDRRWGTGPWVTLAGAFLGLLAAVAQTLAAIRWAGDGAGGADRRR